MRVNGLRVKRIILMLLLVLVWANTAQADPASEFGVQQPKTHVLAPLFVLSDLQGQSVALQSLRGKVVLLHFWATWCVACRHEMPRIEKLWQDYEGKDFVLLGVNVDQGSASNVGKFIDSYALSFVSLLDPDSTVRNSYGVRALPTTYIIGKDGKIVGRIIGERDWYSSKAVAWLRLLLME